MEDKCPFCGSEKLKKTGIEFDCGNYQAHEMKDDGSLVPYWDRTKKCYVRENTALQAQLAAVRKFVKKDLFLSAKLPNEPRHYECRWCKKWAFQIEEIKHEDDCIQTILTSPEE